MSDEPIIWLRVHGLPQAKGSMKGFIVPGVKHAVLTSTNVNLKGWEQIVRSAAQEKAPVTVPTGPMELLLLFEMRKPVKAPKIKFVPHIIRPDLDKLIRAVNDALIGVMYRDDSQVVHVAASKYYGTAPGVLIRIAHAHQGGPP